HPAAVTVADPLLQILSQKFANFILAPHAAQRGGDVRILQQFAQQLEIVRLNATAEKPRRFDLVDGCHPQHDDPSWSGFAASSSMCRCGSASSRKPNCSYSPCASRVASIKRRRPCNDG